MSAWRIFLRSPALPSFFNRTHIPICQMGKLFELSYLSSSHRRPLLALIIKTPSARRISFISSILHLDFASICIPVTGCVCVCIHLYVCQGVVPSSVERRLGKFLTMIIDLSISSFSSINFCFIYFLALLFTPCILSSCLGGLTLYCYVMSFHVCTTDFLPSEVYLILI